MQTVSAVRDTLAVLEASEPAAGERPARRRRTYWQDQVVERVIVLSAAIALSLIVLIFIFVGREALPVLTSPEVHEEVTLDRLFLAQDHESAGGSLPYV